jgi:hypothetical protein
MITEIGYLCVIIKSIKDTLEGVILVGDLTIFIML